MLIALYTVHSDRMFCEQLNYNILFRWFLDMNLEEASFDATSFTKNRERLPEGRPDPGEAGEWVKKGSPTPGDLKG